VPAWFEFGRAVIVRAASPDTDDAVDDEGVERARAALLESTEGDGAFAVLSANARLAPEEVEVLALLATAEIDVHCRRVVSSAYGANRVTLGAIAQIMGADHLGPLAVGPTSPLSRAAFVDVGDDGAWADHAVALHRSVVWSLVGDTSPDPDLPIDLTTFATGDGDGDGDGELVVVTGGDRRRRRHVGALAAFGDRFLCADAPASDIEWAALIREATITGRGLIIEVADELTPMMRRWLTHANHLVWVVSSRSGPPVDQMPERQWTEVVAPTSEPTDAEWTDVFGPGVDRSHRLTFDQMYRVQRARDAVGGDIDAAVRRLASGPLEHLTRRITPTRTWDDIVLSPDRLALLRSVVDRYQHANEVYDDWGFSATPSRGLVALFSGPSGTGKTLASEIIAGALGLDVFKLDLSSVVSKYIGETEKNLEQIFDAASAGNMVLFFDEADSLFGKRSEVKDARDRYANIEVSYLLQRLEAYDGLVVMATNFEKNVDEAFLRRIHVRVEFALPGAAEREMIWRTNFPAQAPVDGVDFAWLAQQFELSGGSIRNAAIHAAFVAAAAGTTITMESAVIGVAREFRKMGRLIKPTDFGEHFVTIAD